MIEAFGFSELIVKSGGESSIVALKRAAVSELRRQGHAIQVQFEEAPKGDSQRNGVVERAIWEVEAQVRLAEQQRVEELERALKASSSTNEAMESALADMQ